MAASVATTETEVANMALSRIGVGAISDLDSPGTDKAALAIRRIYADTRDEVCRSFPWASITGRTALSTSTATASVFDWQHTLATPVLFVLEVVDTSGTENINYRIEGSTLYTNSAAGYIRRISQTATVLTWDALLLEAIVLRLASKLAVPLAGDLNLSLTVQREYVSTLALAMVTKAIEQREDNKEILAILDRQFAPLLFGKDRVSE